VRENRQSNERAVSRRPWLALVFASGHMPIWADTRFDLGRYDYANYLSDAV
jgi:hypothetical protein